MKLVLSFNRFWLRGLLLGLAVVLSLAPVRDGNAQTSILTVCKAGPPACQYTTLQAAIDAALNGDEIHIAGGEYSDMTTVEGVTQIAYVSKPLTIKGGYSQDFTTRDTTLYPTTLDANRAGRVMVIDGIAPVTIDGLTITEGRAIYLAGWGCMFGMSPNPAGGGVFIRDSNVTITNTRFINNAAGYYTNEQGCGGGLFSEDSNLNVAYSTFDSNKGSTNQGHYSNGGGMLVTGGTGFFSHNTFINNNGSDSYGNSSGGAMVVYNGVFTIENNLFQGNIAVDGGAVSASTSSAPGVIIRNNTFTGNTGGYFGGAIVIGGLTTVEGNLFTNNTNPSCGGALCVRPGTHYINNNVFIGNTGDYNGGAIGMTNSSSAGDTVYLSHNTFSNNTGKEAIHTCSWCTVYMTNAIIANSTGGINHTGGSYNKFYLTNTLFYNNTTDLTGSFVNTNPLSGDPAFDSDGYHLTETSAAIDKGARTDLSVDIDGDVRVRGTAPDIGADESPYSAPVGLGIAIEKIAAAPRWINRPAVLGGGYSEINYYMRFMYGEDEGTNPDISELTIEDDLPNELTVDQQISSDTLSYTDAGGKPTWQSTEPLSVDDWVWMELHTSTDQAGGLSMHNSVTATYQFGDDVDRQVTDSTDTVLPVFPPLLTSPESGETCYDDILFEGQAQPGALIRIYANSALLTTVTADADTGAFSRTAELAVSATTTITATAELNSVVSESSTPIRLDPTSQFWCPQASYIEGFRAEGRVVVSKFRGADGRLSSTTFTISGPAGHHRFNIMPCDCPPVEGSILPPTEIYIEIDGTKYTGAHDIPSDLWKIDVGSVLGSVMEVYIVGVCNGEPIRYRGGTATLIDPDGYIYDIDKGFDEDDPQASAIEDLTITAYAYIHDLGGWVPWPAHLYGQTNPQVTNGTFADGVLTPGYFAFFTPPGKYYLEVTAGKGYQGWRSPEIEVIADPVHMNIPLTPQSTGLVTQVILSPEEPTPALVRINSGETVEWVSTLGAAPTLSDLVEQTENPVMRVLSSLGLPASLPGFDSGMVIPNQTYRRRFTQAGTYTFTDGQGHTGTIIVQDFFQVFLPLLMR